MPHIKSLPHNSGPPNIFARYPKIYEPFSRMSQALMNGPSPLTPAERELVLAFAAGVAECQFVFVGHSEVAYAWGIEQGLLESLVESLDHAALEPRMLPLLQFVRKLMLTPNDVSHQDSEAVYAAGWDDDALHCVIAVSARAAFMHRLVAGCGFAALDRRTATSHARKRVEHGYVNIYRAFRMPE